MAVTVISPHQHGGTRDRRLGKMAPAATPSPGLKGRRDSSACRGPCPARRGRARRPLEETPRQSPPGASSHASPAKRRRRQSLMAMPGGACSSGRGWRPAGPAVLPRLQGRSAPVRGFPCETPPPSDGEFQTCPNKRALKAVRGCEPGWGNNSRLLSRHLFFFLSH